MSRAPPSNLDPSWMLSRLKYNPTLRRFLFVPIKLRHLLQERSLAHTNRSIDRFANIARGDVRVFVEEFGGEFYIFPRSDIFRRLIVDGEYEPIISKLFWEHIHPELDIMDIGANIGFFSVLGASKLTTGRVFSAEPTPSAAERLRKNIALNNFSKRVSVFEGLVGDKIGQFSINVIEGREEYSSMGDMIHPATIGASIKSIPAAMSTVDELVKSYGLTPGILKIDVEGAEAMVFAGASETLQKYRPVIIAEMSNDLLRPMGSSGQAVVKLLESYGYRVVDPIHTGLPPGSRPFGDIVAFPRP